ncbi:MAG: hypothetical protein DRN64_02745 [Thaumarchaeota archaeon]|nr:MAG: hypothetical protein DRN64_02745 [Nitrososphaerota archaeon]
MMVFHFRTGREMHENKDVEAKRLLKMQNKRKKKFKEVIILGAGASKSEGAPLQNELFKEFFEYYKQVLKGKEGSLPKKQEKLIIEYFKKFWGIDIENFQNQDVEFPTFEECLGILDLAYYRGESFKGYPKKKIEQIRNALIFLIAKVLDEKLQGKIIHHKELVKRLKKEENLRQIAFLSLNYDIIIDNVLVNLYPEFHLDYGIDFINFERENDWKRPNKNKAVLLLKIHGSLNWLYCPTCNHIELTPRKKEAIKAFYKAKKCSECKTPMEPVIIPPTFYKEMTNPFIQKVFLKADKVLRSAERIFICGYSFPDADLHIKYLLKRAEQFRGETPDIYVINNHSNKTEQQKNEEEQRISRFFKNKEKIHYTDLSFEEFAKRGVENV